VSSELFRCPYPCGKSFKTNTEWLAHVQTEHPKGKVCANRLEFNIEDPDGKCPYAFCEQWRGHEGVCRGAGFEWVAFGKRTRADPKLYFQTPLELRQEMGSVFKETRVLE
jgi:hypothetical protein